MNLYPLKFTAIVQYRIWGGNQLNKTLPKELQIDKAGEIWSISGVEGNISKVENGSLKGKNLKELIEIYKEQLVGEQVFKKFGTDFPVLIKFIDAADKLSVQVHPNDEQAKELHGSFGKSEMWYIMDAQPDSELIIGFTEGAGKDDYQRHLNQNSIENILNKIPVEKGDAVYIPAGRVHAIGSGIILAEIQQTSDITYRIYDYNRIDKDGKQRELHTGHALTAIDFSPIKEIKTTYSKTKNNFNPLITSPYFTTKIFNGNQPLEINNNTDMRIYICTQGSIELISNGETTKLSAFQSLIIPASLPNFKILPQTESVIIEVKIP